jgi:hypothetical protein
MAMDQSRSQNHPTKLRKGHPYIKRPYAVSLFLPFSLLLLITLRPALVDMRFKKP